MNEVCVCLCVCAPFVKGKSHNCGEERKGCSAGECIHQVKREKVKQRCSIPMHVCARACVKFHESALAS